MTDLFRISLILITFLRGMMPLYILSNSERDFYKEAYIRRLYKHGYPATPNLMRVFRKAFCGAHSLHGDKRRSVLAMLGNFNTDLRVAKNPGAYIINKTPVLKEILSAVVADYRQKRSVDDDRNNRSQGDDSDVEYEELTEDDEDDEDSDMEEEEEMTENEGAMAILENRNEELAKTLKMKDEECQQLEKKNCQLVEALQKNAEGQVELLNKAAKLEEKNRQLEEALQKKSDEQAQPLKNLNNLDTTKLEEEVRSLKAALHEKDQMLKTALQIQHNLSTLVNKPAPQ